MSQVVEITLRAIDEASEPLGAVSDRFERLRKLVDDFPSGLRSADSGLSLFQPRLDAVSQSLSAQEQGWRNQSLATEQAVKAVESYGMTATDSFLNVESSAARMTGEMGREAAIQHDVWHDMTDTLVDLFDDAFGSIVAGSHDMGDALVSMLLDVTGRMADAAAASPVVIPLAASFDVPGVGSRSAGKGPTGLYGGTSLITSPTLWGTAPAFEASTGVEVTAGSTGLFGTWGTPDLLSTIAPYLAPALAAVALIPSIMSLFEDRPQPRFDTTANVPSTFQGFLGANPSDLLGVDYMNSDAKDSAGQDQTAIQAAYDAVTGGLQSTFKGIYQILPESVQNAWDAVSTDGWTNVMNSTRATVELAVEGHLKLWLSGFTMYMGDALTNATAEVFGETAGWNNEAITELSEKWVSVINDFVDPIIRTMDPAEFGAKYGTFMSNLTTGVSGIMNYNSADLMGDYRKSLTANTYASQVGLIDQQIGFLTDALPELTGEQYVSAIRNIDTLLDQRYQKEIVYLGQLDTLQDSLTSGLNQQVAGFEWDVMTPEERFAKAQAERDTAWTDIYSATTAEAESAAVQRYMTATGQTWQLGGNLYGTDWQKANVGSFQDSKDLITQRVNSLFDETIDQLLGEHSATGQAVIDAFKPATDAVDAHAEALKTATSNVNDFSAAIDTLTRSIQAKAGAMDGQTQASLDALAAQIAAINAARTQSELGY